jgi:acyl carrier protein
MHSPEHSVVLPAEGSSSRGGRAQSPGSLKTALHPKWKGAWNLHTLTRDNDLDFFVLFSSAAALVGSPGQANYAVANAMLDALAEHRRSLGLSALSIQWGPWNAGGMTDKLKVDPQSIGMEKIDALDGVKALEGMLGGEDDVAAVLPVFSWERFVSGRPQGTSSLFSSLIGTEPQRSPAGTRQEAQRERLFEVLTNAAPKERRSILLEHLRQQTIQILSLPSQTRIDQDEILHDLGMDSLMAVELRNALIASLDRQFPPTMVLDYPTLRTLADYMLTSLFAETRSLDVGISNEITTMTDQEAEQLLLSELGREEHGAAR